MSLDIIKLNPLNGIKINLKTNKMKKAITLTVLLFVCAVLSAQTANSISTKNLGRGIYKEYSSMNSNVLSKIEFVEKDDSESIVFHFTPNGYNSFDSFRRDVEDYTSMFGDVKLAYNWKSNSIDYKTKDGGTKTFQSYNIFYKIEDSDFYLTFVYLETGKCIMALTKFY